MVDCRDGSDEDNCHQTVSTGMFSVFAPRMGLYVPFIPLSQILFVLFCQRLDELIKKDAFFPQTEIRHHIIVTK